MISALRRTSDDFEDYQCTRCHVPLLTQQSVCPVCKQKPSEIALEKSGELVKQTAAENTEQIIIKLFPKSTSTQQEATLTSHNRNDKALGLTLISVAVILGIVGLYQGIRADYISTLTLLAQSLMLLGVHGILQKLKALHQTLLNPPKAENTLSP